MLMLLITEEVDVIVDLVLSFLNLQKVLLK